MSSSRIAHVRLAPVDGPSRIDVYYGTHKLINVYLSIRPSVGQVQNFRQSLLQDFISIVQGYIVSEFEASNLITTETIRLFLSVSQQQNRTAASVGPTLGQAHYQPTALSPQIAPQQAPDAQRNGDVQRIMSRIAQAVQNPGPITQDTLSSILGDIGRTLAPRPVPPINLNTVRSNVNPQPQPPQEPQPAQRIRSNVNPQPQPQPQPIQRPPANATALADLMASMTQGNPFAIMQSIMHNQNQNNEHTNQHDETEPPDRFVVNDRNAREVLIHQNPPDDIPPDDSVNDNLAQPVPSHPTLVSNLQRRGNSDETIRTTARSVYNSITTTAIRPPDFTNHNRAGYRKIKNFVHNLTKVWLSQAEIDKFLVELDKLLNPVLDVDDPASLD